MGNISIILGAGFSVPEGYPTAHRFNEKLSSLKLNDFSISSAGEVFWMNNPDEKDPFWYSEYWLKKKFFISLIDFYCQEHTFHYEEFYDYVFDKKDNFDKDDKFIEFCKDFRSQIKLKISEYNYLTDVVPNLVEIKKGKIH